VGDEVANRFTYDVVNRVTNIQHRKGSDNSNIAWIPWLISWTK
jgi:hypothetical protein